MDFHSRGDVHQLLCCDNLIGEDAYWDIGRSHTHLVVGIHGACIFDAFEVEVNGTTAARELEEPDRFLLVLVLAPCRYDSDTFPLIDFFFFLSHWSVAVLGISSLGISALWIVVIHFKNGLIVF